MLGLAIGGEQAMPSNSDVLQVTQPPGAWAEIKWKGHSGRGRRLERLLTCCLEYLRCAESLIFMRIALTFCNIN